MKTLEFDAESIYRQAVLQSESLDTLNVGGLYSYCIRSNSTAGIWGDQRCSCGDHARLLGKSSLKDSLNPSPMGQLVMDEHKQPLEQCMPLMSRGVPTGVDDALHSLRHSRERSQLRQRRGHEDQTSMFSYDFGTRHVRHLEAQRSLALQIKRFLLPPLPMQPDHYEGVPVDPIRDQNDKGTRQFCAGNTPTKAHG
jgi:hypothetical protein